MVSNIINILPIKFFIKMLGNAGFFYLKFMLKGSEDEDQWPPKNKQTRERKEMEKGENKAKILKEDQVFFSVFNSSKDF